jgi:hypothetical protein
MKVISDIIDYLWVRGVLVAGDMDYLRDRGFLPALAAEEPLRPEHEELVASDGADPIESLAAEFDRRMPVRRSGRRRPRSRGGTNAEAISANILRHWPAWEPELAPLCDLAGLIEPVTGLDLALRIVRRASLKQLDAAIVRLLDAPDPALGELWGALAFDGYREGIVPEVAGGQAVRAYRAVLANAGHAEIRLYGRELRLEGYARSHALVQAQRLLLAAFDRCLAARPDLFDRPLFAGRKYDECCYWSLAFALSAQTSSAPVETHAPRRPPPEGEAERRAWACAAAMNGRNATRLLAQMAAREDRIHCPKAWDVGYHRPQAAITGVRIELP